MKTYMRVERHFAKLISSAVKEIQNFLFSHWIILCENENSLLLLPCSLILTVSKLKNLLYPKMGLVLYNIIILYPKNIKWRCKNTY